MTISELIEKAHSQARRSGFWEDLERVGGLLDMNDEPSEKMKDVENMAVAQKLALISTEIAEFEQEAYYRNRGAMLEELADVVIRIFDLAGFLDEPLSEAVFSDRLHRFSTATGVTGGMYREVALSVQAHRKGRHDFISHLQLVVKYAQDFVSANYSDSYALRRTVIEKMYKNEQREHRHGAAY